MVMVVPLVMFILVSTRHPSSNRQSSNRTWLFVSANIATGRLNLTQMSLATGKMFLFHVLIAELKQLCRPPLEIGLLSGAVSVCRRESRSLSHFCSNFGN
jgi:hypothetical protein